MKPKISTALCLKEKSFKSKSAPGPMFLAMLYQVLRQLLNYVPVSDAPEMYINSTVTLLIRSSPNGADFFFKNKGKENDYQWKETDEYEEGPNKGNWRTDDTSKPDSRKRGWWLAAIMVDGYDETPDQFEVYRVNLYAKDFTKNCKAFKKKIKRVVKVMRLYAGVPTASKRQLGSIVRQAVNQGQHTQRKKR